MQSKPSTSISKSTLVFAPIPITFISHLSGPSTFLFDSWDSLILVAYPRGWLLTGADMLDGSAHDIGLGTGESGKIGNRVRTLQSLRPLACV